MAYKNYTLQDFQRMFSDPEYCLQAIFRARWPRGFVCPKCGHNDGVRIAKRRVMQCCACRRQTSITAGTLFHKTKLPLSTWFLLIFLMTQDKGGISTERAAKLLNMHYTTVWNIMHKIRTTMSDRIQQSLLSGFVEIDDAFFGGKNRKKPGRGALGKKQVCVMVERLNRKAGDAAIVVLPDPDGSTYRKVVESRLEPMTHVQTDGYSANSVLHGIVAKLNMNVVSKTKDYGPLENVDRVTSLAKRYLLGTYHHYCRRGHLQLFLDEFCYRFNRRGTWSQLASRLLSHCSLHAPVPYAAIS